LERSLGVRLFERSRQGVQVSREGAAILPPVQRFTEHARQLQQAVTDARQSRTGVVMIGALIRRCLTSCRGLMRTAKQNYAQLSLSSREMQSADALAAVQSGEIDIALARLNDRIAALDVRPIVHDHLVLVLPIDHSLTRLSRVALRT
jgi:DNA-binding transcriptional LysR family regulator